MEILAQLWHLIEEFRFAISWLALLVELDEGIIQVEHMEDVSPREHASIHALIRNDRIEDICEDVEEFFSRQLGVFSDSSFFIERPALFDLQLDEKSVSRLVQLVEVEEHVLASDVRLFDLVRELVVFVLAVALSSLAVLIVVCFRFLLQPLVGICSSDAKDILRSLHVDGDF